MITLKSNQDVDILKSGNRWYTCITDENGLLRYNESLFLSESQERTSINLKMLFSDYEEIKNFNIEEKIKNVKTVEDYSAFVDNFMYIQDVMFEMTSFERFASKSTLPEEHKKGILAVTNGAKELLEAYEALFKDVANSVPSNWAYAMFPERNWTGYAFLVEKHKVANGNTTRFADECYGKTRNDAIQADVNTYEYNKALNQDVHKEEKIFLDLDKQIKERRLRTEYQK